MFNVNNIIRKREKKEKKKLKERTKSGKILVRKNSYFGECP
jgi:hypothetical protein